MKREIQFDIWSPDNLQDVGIVEKNVLSKYFGAGDVISKIAEEESISVIKTESIINRYLYKIKRQNGDFEMDKAVKILYAELPVNNKITEK